MKSIFLIALLLFAATAMAAESLAPLVPEGEPHDTIQPLLRNISQRSSVQAVAFNPDGKILASDAGDGTVCIWDLATPREVARLKGHTNPVTSIVFSPDHKTLASGSSDNTVRLWDLATHREVARLEGHAFTVSSVAFSPDGKTLASGSNDGTVRLWDLATQREVARLEGHAQPVNSVAFSPHGKTLASGAVDNTVRLWELTTRSEVARLEGHTSSVTSVAFSPDGKTLASGSYDNTVRLWDLATHLEFARLEGHTRYVYDVAFSPDSKTLASGSGDKSVRLWDLATHREVARLEGHSFIVFSVAFSPDGKTLASGSEDQTVRLWDLATHREVARLEGHTFFVYSVAFSPHGNTFASCSWDKTVRLWDLATHREIARLEGHTDSVSDLAFSPDGKTLASASSTVQLWNLATHREFASMAWVNAAFTSIVFSPDGKTLASGSRDNVVYLWNPASHPEIQRLKGHNGSVNSVAFSPDGKTLASGSDDKTVRLWDLAAHREVARLEGHTASVNSVAFSPDGKTLASGSGDQTVRLWSLATNREIARLEGHSFIVFSVAFSPDGKTLASGSGDKTLRLWDLGAQREFARLEGYTASVNSVAFSPDGKTLASGSSEKMILFDPITRKATDMLVGGARGTWVWCDNAAQRCWRGDDGTLIVETIDSGRISSRKPPGDPQELEITLDGMSARKVVDGEVLEITARVRNKGAGRAYWLSLVPSEEAQERPWVLQAPILSSLDPGETGTLTARVHMHTPRLNPTRVADTLHLAVRQAYGGLTHLEPVMVEVIPPELKVVEKACVLQERDNKVLALTLKNDGTRLINGDFRIELQGAEQGKQPTQVIETGIEEGGQATLSFGLPQEFKASRELKVDLFAQKLVSPGGAGPPLHDWEFRDVAVIPPSLPWALYAASVVLLGALAAMIYYQRVYRHPLVLRLTASPESIRDLDAAEIDDARKALERAGRLRNVLVAARVHTGWLDRASAFDALRDSEERCRVLADRLGCPCEGPHGEGVPQWSVNLGDDFPLNLQTLHLCLPDPGMAAQDVLNRLAPKGEVVLVVGASQEQRMALADEAPGRSQLLVAPGGPELTSLLLAERPLEELARMIARHTPVTQLSPYQTGAGVRKQSLFFGRGSLIASVMERDPANYLLVGGRQVGKSSMLKELERRYCNNPDVVCRYLVLGDTMLVDWLAESLGLPVGSSLDAVVEHLRKPKRQRHLLLIDEADAFVHDDRKRGYETLQRLRALSEENRAHFILAGFWELYEQAVLDYQSPLLNFGSVLTVGPLEVEACRALAVKPMELLNIRWESPELVERLVEQTGQRANLIATACDDVLYCLDRRERVISARHLDQVLGGARVREQLPLRVLSTDTGEQVLDRILVYSAASGELKTRERFTLGDIIRRLELHGYTPSPNDLKRSLARLELACVFGREHGEYFFQVPLQRDLVLADDPELLLRSELRAAGLA